MDLDAYFARIGYHGPRCPTLPVLHAIAAAQPCAISFENLQVTAGIVPEISLPAIFAKLVSAGRGGYCYEQNTLLQAALEALGFTVTALSARVLFGRPEGHADSRGHMILCVALDGGRWLVDAGFGGLTLTAPVALRFETVQATPHEPLRLVRAGADYRLQAQLGAAWADIYQFDLAPHLREDFISQNWYTATRPQARFAHNVTVARPVAGGRWALFNETLTWRPLDGAPEKRLVAGAEALGAVLHDIFALEIPPEEVTAAARVAAAQRLTP